MLRRNSVVFATGLVLIVVLAFSLLNSSPTCCAPDSADTIQSISPAEYQDQFVTSDTSHLLIDVRTPEEFDSGHILGAVNIPVDSLANRLSEVADGQSIVLYCRSGNRSAQASRILSQAGYIGIYDLGGLNAWTAAGYPVKKGN